MAFEYAARQKGVETIVLDPEGNLEKAVAAMEDLIAKKVDGVSVYTITPELDVTLYEMAKEAGIPITFENSLPCLLYTSIAPRDDRKGRVSSPLI